MNRRGNNLTKDNRLSLRVNLSSSAESVHRAAPKYSVPLFPGDPDLFGISANDPERRRFKRPRALARRQTRDFSVPFLSSIWGPVLNPVLEGPTSIRAKCASPPAGPVSLSLIARALRDHPPFPLLPRSSLSTSRPAGRTSLQAAVGGCSGAAAGCARGTLWGAFGDISCSIGATMKPLLAPGYLSAKRSCYHSTRAPFCLFS